MIFRRLALALAGASALAAAAGVIVVALALALYDLLLHWLAPAGAAAGVAGTVAVVFALAALLLSVRPRPKRAAPTAASAVDRALAYVRENPALAIAAALGAGFLAIRNPRYLGAALRAFVEGRETPRGPL